MKRFAILSVLVLLAGCSSAGLKSPDARRTVASNPPKLAITSASSCLSGDQKETFMSDALSKGASDSQILEAIDKLDKQCTEEIKNRLRADGRLVFPSN